MRRLHRPSNCPICQVLPFMFVDIRTDLAITFARAFQRLFTGLDIGCGANCIYPLLGACLNKWHFVGVDITDVAITWAKRNVKANPDLSELIQIRRTGQSHSTMDPANIAQVILLPKQVLSMCPDMLRHALPCCVYYACMNCLLPATFATDIPPAWNTSSGLQKCAYLTLPSI